MQLDYYDLGQFPADAARTAAAAEAAGLGGCWFGEVAHNPFLSCATSTATTSQISLGTAVAVAFPRSPMVVAQEAWGLAHASDGRFVLGLGTQVKRHVEQRFATPYAHPLARMREYVGALRTIFDAFQSGSQLRFAGDFYSFSLLPQAFSPGPINHPDVPIYVAGVNYAMAHLAGAVADGFVAHPLHSVRYLQEVVAPAIAEGAAAAGRMPGSCRLVVPVFMGFADGEEEACRLANAIRRQIAFYGSTRTYRPVFELHGWDDLPDELHQLQAEGDLAAAADLLPDDVLAEFTLLSTWSDAAARLRARYAGLAARLLPYPLPDRSPAAPDALERWGELAENLRSDT